MKKLGIGLLFGLLFIQPLMAQKKAAYRLYDSSGKKTKYTKAFKEISKADVICFGELHNNPIAHWWQYEMLKDLIKERGPANLVVGAEMFESHQQLGLSAYLTGKISLDEFEDSVKLWPNYETDYHPVVELSKKNKIPVIATNVPRKYARQVSKEGPKSLENLPEDEWELFAPQPYEIDYELPSYANMREMIKGHGGGMNADYFIAAQAIKDATMAHFLLKSWEPGKLFFHLNGSYHSDKKEGILWYVNHYRPGLKVANITVVEQENVWELEAEHIGKADLIIVVPSSMTKTY